MMHEHFRAALEDGDVALARKIYAHVFPKMPQPKNDREAEIILHHARTQSNTVSFSKRAYSHQWLLERALPSGLPDDLKPKAQRMYPITVPVIGVSVNSKYDIVKREVGGAMRDAVLEAEADGRLTDSAHVKGRMQEARDLSKKRLGLK